MCTHRGSRVDDPTICGLMSALFPGRPFSLDAPLFKEPKSQYCVVRLTRCYEVAFFTWEILLLTILTVLVSLSPLPHCASSIFALSQDPVYQQ